MESHSIHQRRATTVILEECPPIDQTNNTNVTISLPLSPQPDEPQHHIHYHHQHQQQEQRQQPCVAGAFKSAATHAIQVEEIGSFDLGGAYNLGKSFSYHANDIDGSHNLAIVDEMDSDTYSDGHASIHQSRTTSRNISINSVSEDEILTPSATKSCDLSVNEITKHVPMDDGVAEMKVTRIVMQEEEVIYAELDDDGKIKETPKKDLDEQYSVHSKIEEKAKKLYAELEENGVDRARKSSLKGVLYDIEEKNEGQTEDEEKALRIKDIRAKARRASLQKQDKNEDEIPQSPIEIEVTLPQKSTDAKPPIAKRASIDKSVEEPKDLYMENLLKQAQRQRSVLDEIVDQKERSLSRSRETSRQRSIVSERKGSISPDGEDNVRKPSFDTRANRPNFKCDIENCTVDVGQPLKLDARVECEGKPKIMWFHNGEQIKPDGFSVRAEQSPDGKVSLHIEKAEVGDRGDYQGK